MSILQIMALADAVRVVYQYGIELRDDNFVELTFEQYEALERQGEGISKRWFRISRGLFEERNNPPEELPIVDEAEKQRLLAAIDLIYKMTDKAEENFRDFRARLAYLKDRLPPGLTGG